jgi:rRNA maturation endonuclease Nob1
MKEITVMFIAIIAIAILYFLKICFSNDHECLNCSKTVKAKYEFCPHCGVKIDCTL